MRQFPQVGAITTQIPRVGIGIPETRVFVTNPADFPSRIKDLRFEPDSPVTDRASPSESTASTPRPRGDTSGSVPFAPRRACTDCPGSLSEPGPGDNGDFWYEMCE